jgi:hypothetical protein
VRARILGKGKFSKTRENLLLVSLWNLPVDLLIYIMSFLQSVCSCFG